MRRIWPAILLLGVSAMAWAVSTGSNRPARLDQGEQQLSRRLTRASQFVNVFHVSARARARMCNHQKS